MAVNQLSSIQAKPASISLLTQPVKNIPLALTAQALALERLGRSINLDIFQELLDLDTPNDPFSKNVVCEYLVMAPEILSTMNNSLSQVNLSQLKTSAQSLRCASMVLGLTRIEEACSRIEIILNLCIDLHYTGFDPDQICEVLGYVVKEAHSHFEVVRTAFSSFYNLPLPSPQENASDASGEYINF